MKEVAVITGGTRGIGLGIARSLADSGCNLVLNGMRAEAEITDVMEDLASKNIQVKYVQGSVGDSDARKKIIAETIETFGQINHLINNAGVAPKVRADILDMSEESYDRVMNTNLKSAVFLSQLAAKEMIKSKKTDSNFNATITNISSISATMVSTARGEYCMSKAGMSMLTQLLAARLGPEGIPVYDVRPGVIVTDMTGAVKEKYDKLIAEGLCVTERWGYPEDVGKAVQSLVRGDLPYSTGQVIMVDGGLSMPRL